MHHTSRPHLYLDTMILLDVILDRPQGVHSKALLERLRRFRGRCTTSPLAFMETLDALQNQHPQRLDRRQLYSIYDGLIDQWEAEYRFIRIVRPSGADFWDIAENICGMTNLRAKDAIHVATAWGDLCDVLVTRDEEVIRVVLEEVPSRYRIPTALPERVDAALVEAGFKITKTGNAKRQR